jgi:hypothetical protein
MGFFEIDAAGGIGWSGGREPGDPAGAARTYLAEHKPRLLMPTSSVGVGGVGSRVPLGILFKREVRAIRGCLGAYRR